MPSNRAWQRHGCYKLGTEQYFNIQMQRAAIGCYDSWNSHDHFDPTRPTRNIFSQFNFLRATYAPIQDGLDLVQRGNWTHFEDLPGSNGTLTEIGLWTVSRAGIPGAQVLNGTHTEQVWLLYTNENSTQSYTFDCTSELWISSPYQADVVVRNVFHPFESYTLQASQKSFFENGTAPFQGCLNSVTMEPFGFKMLVPSDQWVPMPPQLTKFVPGHDARIIVDPDHTNATTVDISFEFSLPMDCDSITQAVSFNMSSSGKGSIPTISNVNCGNVTNPDVQLIQSMSSGVFFWNATLTNMPDGVLSIILNNPRTADGSATTGVRPSQAIHKQSIIADTISLFRLSIHFYYARVKRTMRWLI